jgi:hypothetical protein
VKVIQHSEQQTHKHHAGRADQGFGFTDDHDRVPVEWFHYPDEEEFPDDGFTEMPLVTQDGRLRERRSNGAAISRPVSPVDGPDSAARFVQFLIDHKYAPGPTAALFLAVGVERRFSYRVARDLGLPKRSLTYWMGKARAALASDTVPVPPIDLPGEMEPKRNPRATDYWRRTVDRQGGEIRDAVKATLRQILDAEPKLSDAALARKLTERARVAISRRTVAKYRLALGIRRLKGERRTVEAMEAQQARKPLSEDARRRIGEGQKRRWAKVRGLR